MYRSRSSGAVIVPSIIACDQGGLLRDISMVVTLGAERIHVDHVPASGTSAGYDAFDAVEIIRNGVDAATFALEVHLLCGLTKPLLQKLIELAPDRAIIPDEGRSTRAAASQLRAAGVMPGLSIPNDNNVDADLFGCECFGFIHVPTAEMLRSTGNGRALARLAYLRQLLPEDAGITADGGIDTAVVAILASAGADSLVVGSALFRRPAPDVAFSELSLLADPAWVPGHASSEAR